MFRSIWYLMIFLSVFISAEIRADDRELASYSDVMGKYQLFHDARTRKLYIQVEWSINTPMPNHFVETERGSFINTRSAFGSTRMSLVNFLATETAVVDEEMVEKYGKMTFVLSQIQALCTPPESSWYRYNLPEITYGDDAGEKMRVVLDGQRWFQY